jgi:hypothetical protein
MTSLRLGSFLIAKLAFEHSLTINPEYWPSLDNFIVLTYSLGNYLRKLYLILRYLILNIKSFLKFA